MKIIDIKNNVDIINKAAIWFHSKWGIPAEAYLECMKAYVNGTSKYGWYLCIDSDTIVGGLGVIENDFHNRPDLSPNICAVYVEEKYRGIGIAGKLLNYAVSELKKKGISPVYLVTDHIGFYEKYGWEYFCEVKNEGEENFSRLYIHK